MRQDAEEQDLSRGYEIQSEKRDPAKEDSCMLLPVSVLSGRTYDQPDQLYLS